MGVRIFNRSSCKISLLPGSSLFWNRVKIDDFAKFSDYYMPFQMSNGGFYDFRFFLFSAKLIVGKFRKKIRVVFFNRRHICKFLQILLGNQSLIRFTDDIFATILKNILPIFFVAKYWNFYMHCEQMIDCDYSQVERVLRKWSIYILEYFSNIQVFTVENLVPSKNFRLI